MKKHNFDSQINKFSTKISILDIFYEFLKFQQSQKDKRIKSHSKDLNSNVKQKDFQDNVKKKDFNEY